MRVSKKQMKDVLTIAKRVVQDKKVATMHFQCETGTTINILVDEEGIDFKYLQSIENLDGSMFSFTVNPYDIEKWFTVKMDEMDFEVMIREIKAIGDTKIEIENIGLKSKAKIKKYEEKIMIPETTYRPLNDTDNFIKMLKESEDVLKKNKDDYANHLMLTSKRTVAIDRKRVHLYNLGEDFPFKGCFINKNAVSVLAKSLKGNVNYGIYDKQLTFENTGSFYILNVKGAIKGYPKLREMEHFDTLFSFIIDADDINKKFKHFKSKLKRVEVKIIDKEVFFEPRSDEFTTQKTNLLELTGEPVKVLFEYETIKGLFSAYEGEIKVEHCLYKNIHGKEGYMWRINNEKKKTLASGITEPDYEKVDIQVKQERERLGL